MVTIKVGEQFPPADHVERLAKYKKMTMFYDKNHKDLYQRVSTFLQDTPYAEQVSKLRIPCQLADVICTKPSELLLSEEPILESKLSSDTPEERAINRLVQDNDLRSLVFNLTLGGAIRGDSFLKVFYNYRQDMSALRELKEEYPDIDVETLLQGTKPQITMQTIDPSYVFPVTSRGSNKDFKSFIVAYVEWVSVEGTTTLFGREKKPTKTPFLVVERHLPFYVKHERYLLSPKYTNDLYHGVEIPVYTIQAQVETGLDSDLEYTASPVPLIFPFAYKANDISWQGTGAIEKIADLIVAVSDRLTSLDIILHKHSDPILQGPAMEGETDLVRLAGAYVARNAEDAELKYVTWEAQLQYAFEELDILLSKIFLQAQLPIWLFGSNLTNASTTGGGTSHTDSSTTKLRYAPVSSLLDRIAAHLRKTLGDAFYYAQVLENYANEGVADFEAYEPSYPHIRLSNGIPRNDVEVVENTVLRLQNNIIDQRTAIKLIDGVDDLHADEMIRAIEADARRLNGTVDASIFSTDTTESDE